MNKNAIPAHFGEGGPDEERRLIEDLVEHFLEEPWVKTYVKAHIGDYSLEFDPDEPMTSDQEELYCQYQNMVHVQLVSGMLRAMTGGIYHRD